MNRLAPCVLSVLLLVASGSVGLCVGDALEPTHYIRRGRVFEAQGRQSQASLDYYVARRLQEKHEAEEKEGGKPKAGDEQKDSHESD